MVEFNHEKLVGIINGVSAPGDEPVVWYREGSADIVDPATFGDRKLRISSLLVSTVGNGPVSVFFGPAGDAPAKRIAFILGGSATIPFTQHWHLDEKPVGPKGEGVFVDTTAPVTTTHVVIRADLDP